jgi:DNA-binding CsgD family transcriptional regulator
VNIQTPGEEWASSLAEVRHSESLKLWTAGPLRAFLPHTAVLLGQGVAISGGYAGTGLWSVGLPLSYQRQIFRLTAGVRSPLLDRLLHSSSGLMFFDAARDGANIDPKWLAAFVQAGMSNLLGLAYRRNDPADHFMSSIALYNVPPDAEARAASLRDELMPPLHAALHRVHQASMTASQLAGTLKKLTPVEGDIVRLLLLGKTNKEIAQLLGKSAETVKSRISPLIHRFGVRNRTELVSVIISNQADLTVPPKDAEPDAFSPGS